MDEGKFKSWLDAYGKAWETRDPQAAGELFTEDATYQETPFEESMRGRSSIVDYWSHVPRSQENIRFRYEILSVNQNTGIAHWWTSYVRIPSKVQVKLDGIFVVTFDRDDRCRIFREWWHRQENRPE